MFRTLLTLQSFLDSRFKIQDSRRNFLNPDPPGFKIQDSRRNFLNPDPPSRLTSPGFKILGETFWIRIILSDFPHPDPRLGIQKVSLRILNLESWIQKTLQSLQSFLYPSFENWGMFIYIYIYILKCVHVCMGTGELNESNHINKPVPGGTVIPQYPYIYIYRYIYPYIYIYRYIYIQIYIYIYRYIYIYTDIYIYRYIYIYTDYMYVYIYILCVYIAWLQYETNPVLHLLVFPHPVALQPRPVPGVGWHVLQWLPVDFAVVISFSLKVVTSAPHQEVGLYWAGGQEFLLIATQPGWLQWMIISVLLD